MERLARGDREALAPLMERHHTRLYRIALSYLRDADEALDAVQEIFVKAFQAAARWDPVADVGPWLSRSAVNHSIDCYRKRRRRLQSEEPMPETSADHDARWSAGAPSHPWSSWSFASWTHSIRTSQGCCVYVKRLPPRGLA